ncbi:aldehyde dehydrogenase family protein [Marinobacter sp. LV10R510-11A]|uniref:aldehyde dehydrogenase family protein n=1 Tax=Marinobacter sp. LV10R510-11A TaxID=1415568 RepID=UPI001D0D20A8
MWIPGPIASSTSQARRSPVTLELGGKSPLVVFDDANIENAVSGGPPLRDSRRTIRWSSSDPQSSSWCSPCGRCFSPRMPRV